MTIVPHHHLCFDSQVIRVGSVSVEGHSLKDLITSQERPVDIVFHRRSNPVRHMLGLLLKQLKMLNRQRGYMRFGW